MTRRCAHWRALLLIPLLLPGVAAAGGVERAGDALQLVIPAVALGTTWREGDVDGRGQYIRSYLTTFGVTYALKLATDKRRPDGEGLAFPSGHTSAAFQGAAFMHRRYGLRTAWPVYVAAAFVGYSRVEAKRHDVEDVIAGAALGMLSARLQVEPRGAVTFLPTFGSGAVGITLAARW